jgi:cytochrome c553
MNRILMIALLLTAFAVAAPVQAGGDAARGAELAVDCADCHGADGMGDEDNPKLAGLDEAYQIEQLKAFKSGERVDEEEMMSMYAEDLSDQDMADLAAYYASLGDQ